MQSDGIHPTARAQPIMLDNVWPYLAPLISGSQAIERPKPRIAGNLISSGRAALSSEQ
jgi:hypothetical protein